MSLETEALLERRRLRRRLSFWRTLGVIAVLLVVGGLLAGNETLGELTQTPHIARVSIEGAITEDRDKLKLIKKAGKSDNVRAILVYINSPGGTTTGGESLFEALRDVSMKKPVVAQFGTVAASAGYIAGLGTDHIVARGNTITGSVGVLIQWPQVDQLLEKIGVKMHTIKSGDLKASPNPFEPMDERTRQVTREMIEESNRWFVSLVENRRRIRASAIPGLRSGRVYSGREALQHKLVDQVGGEEEALNWLKSQGVDAELKLVEWKPSADPTGLWGAGALARLGRSAFGEAGGAIAEALSGDGRIGTVGLDGLLSVWHPSEK